MSSLYLQPIDYITTYFEYPSLDKIHGQPTFTTLRRLKKQLKANAQSVPSNLGGGEYGHLGLVLSPEEYAAVSDDPYVPPDHPGPFQLQHNTDPTEAIRLREVHHERIRRFRESLDINRALIRQIVSAISKEYLDELRNDTTNTITASIPDILTYLFDNFSDVTAQDVAKEEAKVTNFYWNLTDPPMTFFNLIEDLQAVATAANVPYTNEQLVAFGIHILQKTGDFELSLAEWFEGNDDDQTWAHFKRHFSAAHRSLKKVRGTQIKSTAFHQANNLAVEVNSNIAELRDELRETMSMFSPPPPPSKPPSAIATNASSLTQTANAAAVSTNDLLQIVMQLQKQLLDISKPTQTTSTGQTTKKSKGFIRNQTNKYCWTHGACGHEGRYCRNKKEGHQDGATFQDKMGGSEAFCKPVTGDNK